MALPCCRFSSRCTARLFAGALLLPALPGLAADPVVSRLAAVQRAGTKLVDITYDLAADAAVAVSMQISGDGGATFAVPAVAVTGAVGSAVGPGTGKALTWNAGADWNGQFSPQLRVKLFVGDGPIAAGLAAIPAGVFSMGDPLNGISAAPVHEVTLSPFYLGKTEVTKGAWDEVRAWAVGRGYPDLSAGEGKAADHPVQTVTWWDAIKWCNARSEKEGLVPCYAVGGNPMRSGTTAPEVNWTAPGYRLPTEAEWEKAARGGLSGKRFPWGDTISHSQANYKSSSSYAYDVSPTSGNHPSYADGTKPYTSPAGSFVANAYGLQDMVGNVWEWCWDRYGAYKAAAQSDPRGATLGVGRVFRGGGWDFYAYGAQVSNRLSDYPGSQYYDLGFRAARSSVPSTAATTSDVSVDTRDPVAWTLFSAAEAGLGVGDVGLVSLSPLDKLSVVGGGEARDGTALKLMAADGAESFGERSVEGPALVSFWWRVSSEKDGDLFSYSIDGALQESISGDGVWLNRSLSLGEGRHALRWTYRQDEAAQNFQGAGFLDELVIVEMAGSGLVRGSFLNSGTAASWEAATTSLPGGASGAALKTGSTPDNGHATIGGRFEGPGLLRWQWKVSAQMDYDWLVCEVNGVEVAGISTKVAAWQSQVVQVPAGAEARWIYRKDAANQSGADSGYLTEVRFDKFAAAPVSFNDWSAAQGGIAPLELAGPGKIQGAFAWLGGFDRTKGPGEGQYVPTVSGGFYRYRYAISKTAGGQVQPQVSRDLASWNSRGMSQSVLSENEAAATVELAIPAAGRIYTRLKADLPAYNPDMIKVAGGALPADSWAGAQSVDGFYMGKYEVPWSEWQRVRTWALANGYALGAGAGRGAEYPVTDVDWYDALKWCNARSEQEGLIPVYRVGGAPYRTGEAVPDVSASAKGYRLPSEKEWEFAARGGVATRGYTYSGSNDVEAVAWYNGNSGGTTHPVGTKLANELGLFDLSGNAWEWCFDAYAGPGRAIRGGSWYGNTNGCRATFRNYSGDPDLQYNVLGFRVARSLVP